MGEKNFARDTCIDKWDTCLPYVVSPEIQLTTLLNS
jgi:hypothetical protein